MWRRISLPSKRLFLIGFQKGRSRLFWCDFVACPSFTAMVFWCGGGLFSAPEAAQREKVGKIGKKAIFNRVSEGTLDTFLVRFRGVSVLHFTAMVLWCGGGLFSASDSAQREKVCKIGKTLFLIGFQKGRSRLFWCDFVACPSFTAMVFWCGGGLFSAPEAVQREKVGKIGKRLFLIGFQKGR